MDDKLTSAKYGLAERVALGFTAVAVTIVAPVSTGILHPVAKLLNHISNASLGSKERHTLNDTWKAHRDFAKSLWYAARTGNRPDSLSL